ncbi:hypothetical protein AHAS_Ahas18G0144700 [Arachis hypogaea]
MKQKRRSIGDSLKDPKKDFSKVIFHPCKEVGHFKYDCPNLKREDKSRNDKNMVLMASWKDLKNDSEEDEESDHNFQACLMVDHNLKDEVTYFEPTNDELHQMIDDLTKKIRKFLNQCYELESENDILKAENAYLKGKFKEAKNSVNLMEENKRLKTEIKRS